MRRPGARSSREPGQPSRARTRRGVARVGPVRRSSSRRAGTPREGRKRRAILPGAESRAGFPPKTKRKPRRQCRLAPESLSTAGDGLREAQDPKPAASRPWSRRCRSPGVRAELRAGRSQSAKLVPILVLHRAPTSRWRRRRRWKCPGCKGKDDSRPAEGKRTTRQREPWRARHDSSRETGQPGDARPRCGQARRRLRERSGPATIVRRGCRLPLRATGREGHSRTARPGRAPPPWRHATAPSARGRNPRKARSIDSTRRMRGERRSRRGKERGRPVSSAVPEGVRSHGKMVAHGRSAAPRRASCISPCCGESMTLVERFRKTGIRRLGDKKHGFRYERSGGAAPSAADLTRIETLKIPPAWRDVAIHPSPRGVVQAVGRDAAGRWQYLYHEAHAARREKRKYERLLRFARMLPKMRARMKSDFTRRGLPREKVLACALKILSFCFLRGGSRVYAEEHGSYGLATLRRRHVSVTGELVSLDFPGKSGKRQQRQIRDPRVARICLCCRLPDLPGKSRDTSSPVTDTWRRRRVASP